MAFTNAFLLGPCTVNVLVFSTVVFSQVMGLGSTNTFTDSGSGLTLTVAVDGTGRVSLSSASVPSAETLKVFVQPVTEPAGPSQLLDVSLASPSTINTAGYFTNLASTTTQFNTYNPVTPNPVPLQNAQGTGDGIGVYARWGV